MTIEQLWRRFPLQVMTRGEPVVLQRAAPRDAAALLRFARGLAEHELLFLRRDITDPAQVDEWLGDARLITLLVTRGDEVCGYLVVDPSQVRWSRHVAEVRVLLGSAVRGLGLGRTLMKEAFRVAGAMGIEKMVAQMTTDQASAINVFQNYGFENEAILQRHVKDRSGATYDLLVMRRWVDASETDILLEQP
jgi:L-amino acid N-acyltransferase YncA